MMMWLAGLAERRARVVLIAAAIFFVAAGALGGGVAKRLGPFGADDPHTDSVVAEQRLEHAGYRAIDVIALLRGDNPRSATGRTRVQAITHQLALDPAVASVSGFLSTGSRDFIARDGTSTYLAVALKATDDKGRQDAAARIATTLAGQPGVSVGGPALAQRQLNTQVEHDLRTAELYAFPLLFLLSLLFFRSLVAALLPLLVGGLAILGAFLVLRLASGVTSISIFALNVATGLGLGLAIDYSLFIINRYREEIARTGPGIEAMRRTLGTAGRTVLFSSLTVAGALASLLVFPQRFLYSMGIGGGAVALVAAAIALLVLPAVLTLLGPRINSLSPRFLARRAERDARPAQTGFWYRLAKLLTRAPGRAAALTAALLIALSLPALGIHFTAVDAQDLPKSASARQVDDTLRAAFPPYRDSPITLDFTGNAPAAAGIDSQAALLPGTAAVLPPRKLAGDTYSINVISRAPPLATQSQQLVHKLRALPGDSLVTGITAHYLDMQHSIGQHLPLALVIIAVLTIAVLFTMTGSLILPLKQLLMNALGLSAMYGLLVLIFQNGALNGFLGFTSQGGLEAPQLVLLFAVVFGLSTDYGVFLISRIKEARDSGYSDSEAVAVGLERTGRIVTAAALLFAVAFGAFLTSKLIITKELGLGPAAAVLIDATIIRAVLVPSLMQLLGKWNWWAPPPLQRLHARIRLHKKGFVNDRMQQPWAEPEPEQ
jgi:RND superfamily putative drug exporter